MLAPPPTSPTRIGEFTLRPAQERTLVAILRAVREFGGALVADPPGTGKTVLALAAVRALGAEHALVIAPAALRAQWLDSAARAEQAIAFVSLESLSRSAVPSRARLVVVDEAHHARTPTTRRYARLAECCLGAEVLLLSATPVVNRVADRDALLALFLGARSATLGPETLSRCIVRGDAADSGSSGASGTSTARPSVRSLGVIGRGVDVPGLADAIASLPPPLSLGDGTHASALIAMSLAMAWRSSLAALDAALRRRLQRGRAVRDILMSGQTPSHAMLRHWVLHDDATQLALGALLAPTVLDGAADASPALAALDAHLDAVAALRERIRHHRSADAVARARAIRALAQAHPDRRVVVFARHAETIRALYAALRAEPGVVAIVGSRVLAAAGRWSRDEVLRALGPRARPLRATNAPGERRGEVRAIRIVLATDVVAEGVEMQGAGIVVHGDIPWTPARLEQRIGRVTRVGSLQREVFEARIAAPIGAGALIRLGARLRRKSGARDRALRDARAHTRISTVLEDWRLRESTESPTARTSVRNREGQEVRDRMSVAAMHADRSAFVAVVGEPPRWLVGERRGGRWRISSSPCRVAHLLLTLTGDEYQPTYDEIAHHERRIARALEHRAASVLASSSSATSRRDGASAEPAVARRRIADVRARFARILAHAPALVRAEIAVRQAQLLARLGHPLELAREHRLDALLRADLDDATFSRRLGALLHTEDRRAREPDAPDRSPKNDKSRPSPLGRLHCLLILRRASGLRGRPVPAPPSASPGIAAPR